ncbi:ribonuclease H [Trifolium pratense]|uniref:Ribonuclease H n=1 Tax=Trifolium pratense TaxID=57577 RepID=A0A2K3NS85_TRIPR|nr:ribonuclease H [Trifolium pratense]
MSVLVNGSPTTDFKVSKGLRQGDPLSPFLFLIAAEDDTVLVGEGSWENIWTIKTILRGFELVSGMRINFVKSKLYRINVNDRFLEAASNFLLCRAEAIPFKFLGLPVGANPRRYKENFGNLLSWNGVKSRPKDSIWWRDILKVGGMEDDLWFPKNVSSVLGDGNSIGIWKEKWPEDVPLRELFPNLFFKEVDHNVVVAKWLVGNRVDRSWNWHWNSDLTSHEEGELLYLQQLLLEVEVLEDRTDNWKWKPDNSGMFSVKSAYSLLQNGRTVREINTNMITSLQQLWKNDIPSKVGVFGWRLLLEKLPTRAALASRGILTNPHDLPRVFCFTEIEDCMHLFFNCKLMQQVWRSIYKWLGCAYYNYGEGWKHFNFFGGIVKSKKGEKVKHLIWLVTTWCIWRLRNNIIFRGALADCAQLVDQIKLISWVWFIGRSGRHCPYLYSDWCVNPLECILSM